MLKKILLLCAFSFVISNMSFAQNFERVVRQQKASINSIYKKRRITQREYYKLMDEQNAIENTIRKYRRDGYLSPDEKNKIAAKQRRAADRIRRYQRNRERY
ncbi:MAG TPA: hypothetical protein PK110_07095 [Niabella sp.]|jgi:ATP-dependent protease HslVU (ClpYQ) ATPase subunit|nr:hypothetical protein [Chitinophagaceae bacterium]HRO84572.1 hypothetical protein [Niabella sp.]HUN01495.1 hypothetical protein [Niabella sp.]